VGRQHPKQPQRNLVPRTVFDFDFVGELGVRNTLYNPLLLINITNWQKLKQRLKVEGNETVTNCHGLKMLADDGKMRITDVPLCKKQL
jgi:hypothetical protein